MRPLRGAAWRAEPSSACSLRAAPLAPQASRVERSSRVSNRAAIGARDLSWRRGARRHVRPTAAVEAASGASALVALAAHRLAALAFTSPGICFDEACQQAEDRAFVLALALPMALAALAAAYVARPPPKELAESGRLFEDGATGTLFEAPEGVEPERDKNGELAFRPISYTPWPVDPSFEGERLRIPVGPVARREHRTFVFARALPVPSDLIMVTLPRPLGVVLEYDERFKRATVIDLVEGSVAEQRRKKASLGSVDLRDCVLPGDVLRGLTSTNFVYPTKALFGASPPERHVVVYGADQQSWDGICGAMRRGEPRDGDVTLVLERRRPRGEGERAPLPPDAGLLDRLV